jgi:hypothetical protein
MFAPRRLDFRSDATPPRAASIFIYSRVLPKFQRIAMRLFDTDSFNCEHRAQEIPQMAQAWTVSGSYFETCNCETLCPCIFLSPPTHGDCTVLVGWHIDKGSLGNVALDGLNLAAAFHSPGHMAQGNWKAAFYLDARASDPQKDALVKIFSGQMGGAPAALAALVSQVLGVKSAAIEFRAEGNRRRMSIAGVGEAEIQAIAGGGGAEVTISNHPLGIAPGYASVVSKSEKLEYRDHGMQWSLSGCSGQFSPFKYEG